MKTRIDNIFGIINTLSASEREFLLGLLTEDSITVHAHQYMKGDVDYTSIPSKRANSTQKQKVRKYSDIRKDKSKAGVKGGSVKGGFPTYDAWGKREKLTSDMEKDYKSQLRDMEDWSYEDTMEMGIALSNEFSGYVDRYTKRLQNLEPSVAERIARSQWELFNELHKPEMLDFLKSLFPGNPIPAMKSVIEDYMSSVKTMLEMVVVQRRNYALIIKADILQQERDRLRSKYNDLGKQMANLRREMDDLWEKKDSIEKKMLESFSL